MKLRTAQQNNDNLFDCASTTEALRGVLCTRTTNVTRWLIRAKMGERPEFRALVGVLRDSVLTLWSSVSNTTNASLLLSGKGLDFHMSDDDISNRMAF